MPNLTLFPPTRSRRSPRVMAEVVDGGSGMVRAVCGKCGFDEWVINPGDRIVRKVACPVCNEVGNVEAAPKS